MVNVRVVTSSSLTIFVAISAEFNVSKPLIVEMVRNTSAVPGATVIMEVAVGVVVSIGVETACVTVTVPIVPVTLVVPVIGIVLVAVIVLAIVAVVAVVAVIPVVAVVPVVSVRVGVLDTVVAASGVWLGASAPACPLLRIHPLAINATASKLERKSETFFIAKPHSWFVFFFKHRKLR